MATIEIAELGDLIFQDLASNLDAVAEFTNPYGYAHKIETTTVQGVADFQWIIFPGEPLGVYHIKLSQGQQQATGTFTVRRATTYHATALPQQAPAGATFWVALAGLAPNTALPLYLYQRLAGTSVYLTALPNVTTNANGEALATLTTQPADAPGDYLIVTSLDLPGASLSVVNGTGPPPTDVTPIPLDQVSPLQRHDTPPPGVDSRVRFDLASSPVLVADSVLTWMGPVEVADPAFKISLDGFEANKPVVAEFTYPNGHIELETRTANSIGYVGGLDWRSMPGEPLGQYQVTATQGMRQARGTFRMQRATHPHVGVLPVSGRPGTTFRIGLAGFPPGSGVPLYLYYADQYNAEYVRALPVTQTDAHGEATLTLATAADDPKGIYGIVTRDQATINSEDYEYTKVSLIRPQP